ncbi:hypothetical protein BJ508DRAFT_342480 [Ascobolus immersus RN42]|uniref:Uncharacterized protein n=1 Tax=Ascobolus immersus RN42 TaxID=1160509 RepID=A0A3N4IUB6_ASCIM|nr:hypothetical protein BJ508DRAFT_342480 [Ascobolus immersus RN42]
MNDDQFRVSQMLTTKQPCSAKSTVSNERWEKEARRTFKLAKIVDRRILPTFFACLLRQNRETKTLKMPASNKATLPFKNILPDRKGDNLDLIVPSWWTSERLAVAVVVGMETSRVQKSNRVTAGNMQRILKDGMRVCREALKNVGGRNRGQEGKWQQGIFSKHDQAKGGSLVTLPVSTRGQQAGMRRAKGMLKLTAGMKEKGRMKNENKGFLKQPD